MLSFEGETGPYAQYTHARACSILRKAGVDSIEGSVDTTLLTDEASVNVCKALDEFPAKFVDAAEKNEPYIYYKTTLLKFVRHLTSSIMKIIL